MPGSAADAAREGGDMARVKLIGVLVGTALLASFALGSGAASGDVGIHLMWPTESLRVQILDAEHDGLTMGDRLAARGPLYDAANPGTKVGRAFVDCWVAKNLAGGHGLFNCTYLLELDGGDITLQGLDPPGDSVSRFAVTGGDAAYLEARGDAVFTDTEAGTEMEITLVD
jgi:hypothetical protein